MKKALTAAMAAVTLGGAVAAAATPAAAQRWHGGYYGGHYYHHGSSAGPAIAAGVLGLALGAAIASDHPRYYERSYYYDRPYYGGYYDYGYYGPPRVCVSTHWVWDPYVGHRVPVHERYPC